jgi:hypothetical protein
MCHLPTLPRYKELVSELRPLHDRLSLESSVAKRHPVYRCNEVQVLLVAGLNAKPLFLHAYLSYTWKLKLHKSIDRHGGFFKQSLSGRILIKIIARTMRGQCILLLHIFTGKISSLFAAFLMLIMSIIRNKPPCMIFME